MTYNNKIITSARRECERQSWIYSYKLADDFYVPIDHVAKSRIEDYERKIKYTQQRIKVLKEFRIQMNFDPNPDGPATISHS